MAYLTQYCPSACPKGITFVFFSLFWVCVSLTANRDLADRGLPAGDSKKAVVFVLFFVQSIVYINSLMDCNLGLVMELLYHKQ